jgi:hypothetical protein
MSVAMVAVRCGMAWFVVRREPSSQKVSLLGIYCRDSLSSFTEQY